MAGGPLTEEAPNRRAFLLIASMARTTRTGLSMVVRWAGTGHPAPQVRAFTGWTVL